ncbi:MAG: sigma-70 family RNA polymerase sigma factor [Rhodocyclaceae bacterium]|nr:sigma-70 family RNA polymerase sigma factor [Rhodocyclaceae bacterium]
MPEPLKKKGLDGQSYTRPPEIEAWITRLEDFDVSDRLTQFEILTKRSRDYVPSEVLIYFLRRSWASGARSEFDAIFRALALRVERSLLFTISDARMAGALAIREDISGRFFECIAKDCTGRAGLLDFFEIRFDKAFAAIRTSALRQIGPSAANTVPIGTDDGDGLEISDEVEHAASDFLSGDPSKLDDPAFRLELTAAIDTLPSDQKRVMELLRQGFQIDSKDNNVMTIARILQCDERTVRNRRDRACKVLKAVLQQEDVL